MFHGLRSTGRPGFSGSGFEKDGGGGDDVGRNVSGPKLLPGMWLRLRLRLRLESESSVAVRALAATDALTCLLAGLPGYSCLVRGCIADTLAAGSEPCLASRPFLRPRRGEVVR